LRQRPHTESGVSSLSRLLLFNLFLLSLLIVSTRLATLFHEVLGHGVPAAAMGAEVNGIRLSLFGGGNAYYRFGGDLGPAGAFAVSFGGILVNMMTGAAAILWAGRQGPGRTRAVFLSLFGMVSLLGGLIYASLGFYYGVGDPVAWMDGFSGTADWLWLPTLLLLLPAAFFGVKAFFRSIHPWFSAARYTGRVVVLALTLGVTGSIYAGLYQLTGQRSVALETSSIAQTRAAEKARREFLAAKTLLRAAHPEWTEDELAIELMRILVLSGPDEKAWRPPLIPILAVVQIIGALFALRSLKTPAATFPRPSTAIVVSTAGIAAAVIGFLLLTSGWIWKVDWP
jgi:hypothetical protein